MKPIAWMAVAGLMAVATPAAADDVVIDAPIRSVVVYPQGAAVTREGQLVLPAGDTVVVFDNIPLGIDTSSVRVEGIGGAQIQSVLVQNGKSQDDDNAERDELVERIEGLRDDLLALGDQRVALEAQRLFINNLIEAGPAGFADLLGGQGAGIDQWAEAWEMIGDGIYRIESELRDLSFEQRDIEAEIQELLDELASLPTVPPHLEILVETTAAAETEVTLSVSYRVTNAGWAPAYDAFLATGTDDEEPTVTLVRRAEITQTTGEDWTEVALTLSTTRPSGGTAVPTVGEAILGIYETARLGAMDAAAQAAEAVGIGPAVLAPAPAPIAQTEAVADFGDFRADYIIPTPVTVASGGGTRSVRIATDEATAHLSVEVAPRYAEEAYLTAAFTLDTEAPVLAGRVNLFRDDAYVGTGRLGFSNPGAEISLGFGVDDQVRVTWMLVDRNSGERGLLTRIAFDEVEYRATVENGHSRAIEITVIDRVPVSDDARVVVDRLPQMTEPTEEDVGGRRGVVAWTYDYEPGESRDIINAYVMSWPADMRVYGAQ